MALKKTFSLHLIFYLFPLSIFVVVDTVANSFLPAVLFSFQADGADKWARPGVIFIRFQAYSAMSPNGEPAAPILGSAVTSAASLPPMSTFRGSGAVAANSGTGAPSPASLQYSHSPGAPTTAPSAPNPPPTTNQPPATGDNLGKTLASVVSTRVSIRLFIKLSSQDRFSQEMLPI